MGVVPAWKQANLQLSELFIFPAVFVFPAVGGVFSPSNPYHARGSSSTVIPSDTKVEGVGHLEGPSTLMDAVCWGRRSPDRGQGWRLNKPKPRLCWRQRLGPLSHGRSWTKYYCWVMSRCQDAGARHPAQICDCGPTTQPFDNLGPSSA